MGILEALTILFAPDDCLSCSREGSLLCDSCFRFVPPLPYRCLICAVVTDSSAICNACLAHQPYEGLQVATHYSGLAKLLVASLKFRGNRSAGRIMAQMLVSGTRLNESTIIAHMPATTAHVRQRGFDQAAVIAKHIVRINGGSFASVLRRSGSRHQFGSDRSTRLKQLATTLRVTGNMSGKRIVLVDDVVTTGASLRAATEVLLAAGAERVDCLVFAQAMKTDK